VLKRTSLEDAQQPRFLATKKNLTQLNFPIFPLRDRSKKIETLSNTDQPSLMAVALLYERGGFVLLIRYAG
jgi:hypothetical protein